MPRPDGLDVPPRDRRAGRVKDRIVFVRGRPGGCFIYHYPPMRGLGEGDAFLCMQRHRDELPVHGRGADRGRAGEEDRRTREDRAQDTGGPPGPHGENQGSHQKVSPKNKLLWIKVEFFYLNPILMRISKNMRPVLKTMVYYWIFWEETSEKKHSSPSLRHGLIFVALFFLSSLLAFFSMYIIFFLPQFIFHSPQLVFFFPQFIFFSPQFIFFLS